LASDRIEDTTPSWRGICFWSDVNVGRMPAKLIPMAFLVFACGGTAPAARDPERPAGAPLDDGQIAEVVNAMDVEQTRTAELAASRASDPGVRSFADELLADHKQEHQAELDLLSRTHIELQTSILIDRFESSSRESRNWLSNENGASFDRVFVGGEIKELTRQLGLLDRMLIPGAEDAGLRAELQRRRGLAAALLDEARHLFLRFPAPP
jgi:putative membrane protein